MPLQVVGQRAHKSVCSDPLVFFVVDGANLQMGRLQIPEGLLHIGQRFVPANDVAFFHALGRDVGTHHVAAVEQ